MNFWNNLFLSGIRNFPYGSIEIEWPNGKVEKISASKTGPTANLKITDDKVVKEIINGGSVKFAELYMAKRLTSSNLTTLMHYFALNNNEAEDTFKVSILKYFFNKFSHFKNKNSQHQAKKNISYHYDLGNKFYSYWLDKSMTYSSAIFSKPTDNLEIAQKNKYKKLAELVSVKDGDNILEIGCGWGGFSEFLGREYDCKITAITISKEQYNFAKKRIKKENLENKIDIRYCDYRNIDGKFDKVLSIEMFEAVGKEYWNNFFSKIRKVLNPDGKVGLQLITIDDKIYDVYKNNPDFIQKYIFPGGMLPSFKILRNVATKNYFKVENVNSFSDDYAKTLNIWNKRFNNNWKKIEDLGFDETFKLMWNYYLSYCEGGFLSNNIDLKQIKLNIN
jgi:cyclopropane-fatty-acyl-phospholipid synthase